MPFLQFATRIVCKAGWHGPMSVVWFIQGAELLPKHRRCVVDFRNEGTGIPIPRGSECICSGLTIMRESTCHHFWTIGAYALPTASSAARSAPSLPLSRTFPERQVEREKKELGLSPLPSWLISDEVSRLPRMAKPENTLRTFPCNIGVVVQQLRGQSFLISCTFVAFGFCRALRTSFTQGMPLYVTIVGWISETSLLKSLAGVRRSSSRASVHLS